MTCVTVTTPSYFVREHRSDGECRMGHSNIAITADLHGHILEGQDRAAADIFNIALSEAFQEVVSPR